MIDGIVFHYDNVFSACLRFGGIPCMLEIFLKPFTQTIWLKQVLLKHLNNFIFLQTPELPISIYIPLSPLYMQLNAYQVKEARETNH